MDPEIRPQDDLFGHVNGRWLDTVEIPADRSSWGPGVQREETSELQVRAIIAELADGISQSTPDDGGMSEDARKIAALCTCFMDELTAEKRP